MRAGLRLRTAPRAKAPGLCCFPPFGGRQTSCFVFVPCIWPKHCFSHKLLTFMISLNPMMLMFVAVLVSEF
jgi:hypothetical protein